MVTSQKERIEKLNAKIQKLEAENILLKRNAYEFSKMDLNVPSIREMVRTLDLAGITERKEYLAMPPSKELRAVTDRSIADLFVNYGLATSRFFTVISKRVHKLTSVGKRDFENERKIIEKNEFTKGIENAFDLPKDLANTR